MRPINDEKTPDFSVDDIVYRGIKISSRYNKFSEVKSIIKAIDYVDASPWIGSIESIWCDSKACAVYSITCRGINSRLKEVAKAMDNAFYSACGGHNGIFVQGDGSAEGWANPRWKGDEELA